LVFLAGSGDVDLAEERQLGQHRAGQGIVQAGRPCDWLAGYSSSYSSNKRSSASNMPPTPGRQVVQLRGLPADSASVVIAVQRDKPAQGLGDGLAATRRVRRPASPLCARRGHQDAVGMTGRCMKSASIPASCTVQSRGCTRESQRRSRRRTAPRLGGRHIRRICWGVDNFNGGSADSIMLVG
jgi:hypothetical protein